MNDRSDKSRHGSRATTDDANARPESPAFLYVTAEEDKLEVTRPAHMNDQQWDSLAELATTKIDGLLRATLDAAGDLCAVFPTWCDVTKPGHLEHRGTPDMAPVIATAERLDFESRDDGVTVPRVIVDIEANHIDHPGQEPDIGLTVFRPDGRWSGVRMTVDEADFLRRHLVQVLRDLGRDVPR